RSPGDHLPHRRRVRAGPLSRRAGFAEPLPFGDDPPACARAVRPRRAALPGRYDPAQRTVPQGGRVSGKEAALARSGIDESAAGGATDDAWYERGFGEEYLHLYPHRDEEEAARAVALLLREIVLEEGSRILDLACG